MASLSTCHLGLWLGWQILLNLVKSNLGNNTDVWIMYLGIYDRESLPTLGNNTGVWIMYLGLYDREALPTLGTTQLS